MRPLPAPLERDFRSLVECPADLLCSFGSADGHAKLDKLLARVDTLKPEEPDYAKLVIEAVNAFIVHAYEQELALPILTAQMTEEENTVSL